MGYNKEEPEALRQEIVLKPHEELYLYFRDLGHCHEAAQHLRGMFEHLSPPLQKRFDHWFHTGELIDDLTLCGWSIGAIVKHRRILVPDAFRYFFAPAFVRPWISEEEYARHVNYEFSAHERFRSLGWKEKDEVFPSHEELLKWFQSHPYNGRYDPKDQAQALTFLVRPLLERFVDWYYKGTLRDDLEIAGWSLGRFLETFVMAVPTAFLEFNRLFTAGFSLETRVEAYNEFVMLPHSYHEGVRLV